MMLIAIEGNWINPEQICAIRPNPDGDGPLQAGIRTEILLVNQSVRVGMTVDKVLEALRNEGVKF